MCAWRGSQGEPALPEYSSGRAHVEDRQGGILEPLEQLVPGRHRLGPRLQARPRLLQLDRSRLEVAGPAGDAARQDRHLRMARELGGLGRRRGADAVAAVVEDEALLAGDAVAPEPALHLDRELVDGLRARERRRRAEHQRDRARQVAALVRVRSAHVAEHEIRLAQALLHPGRVDQRRQRHSAATTSRSAATAGRASSCSSHAASDGPSSTPKRSSARRTQGT